MTAYIDHSENQKIALPVAPIDTHGAETEMEIYARFMRHLRHVPNNRMEIKILSAIQFTADMTGSSDAHVAKVLVDFGLLAPRMAYPAEFLRFADQSLMRSSLAVGGPSKALLALQDHWVHIGEDQFAAYKGDYRIAGGVSYLHTA